MELVFWSSSGEKEKKQVGSIRETDGKIETDGVGGRILPLLQERFPGELHRAPELFYGAYFWAEVEAEGESDGEEVHEEEEIDSQEEEEVRFIGLGEEAYARNKCMSCPNPPVIDVQWADGRGRAWFCETCFKDWIDEDEREIVRAFVVDGEVPEKIGDNKGKQLRTTGSGVSQSDVYDKLVKAVSKEQEAT